MVMACLLSAALRQARSPAARLLHTSPAAAQDPLRFCVVGSGPAGFYTVDKVSWLNRVDGC